MPRSGALDREEIRVLSKKMHKRLSEEQLDAAMRAMDEDGSGEVDFPEFFKWFTSDAVSRSSFALAMGSSSPPAAIALRLSPCLADPSSGDCPARPLVSHWHASIRAR